MKTLTILVLLCSVLLATGCHPARRVAEGTEDVARGTGERVGHATHKVGEGISRAGRKLEEKAR